MTDASDLTITEAAIPSLFVNDPLPSDSIITGAKETYELAIELLYGLEPTYGRLEITLPEEIEIDVGDVTTTCVAYEEGTIALLSCEIVNNRLVYVTHTSEDIYKNLIVKV